MEIKETYSKLANSGLEEEEITRMIEIFSKQGKIKKVILYGSRAMGTWRPNSDIDLTIQGESLTLDKQFEIENELDDLMMPYKIDISLLHHIKNQDLLDHINEVGIVFFER